MGVYGASKAALSMLVKVAAEEWGPDGLRVNAVGPGVTNTPMLTGGAPSTGSHPWLDGVVSRTSLGRLGEADDIARTILAVHAMEWVTGQVIECDGGLSLRSPIDAYGAAHAARRRRRRGQRRNRVELSVLRPQPVADDGEQVGRRASRRGCTA